MLRDVRYTASKRLEVDRVNTTQFEVKFIYDPDRPDAGPYMISSLTIDVGSDTKLTLSDSQLNALIDKLEQARDILRECKAEAEREEGIRNGKRKAD